MQNEFGRFLLSKRKETGLTQKQLADKIGKSTMCVSLFESGENLPPSGLLLEKMIKALNCDDRRALLFRFYSAKARNVVPDDIKSFFFQNEVIYEAISLAKDNKLSSKDLMYLIASYIENHPIEELSNEIQNN